MRRSGWLGGERHKQTVAEAEPGRSSKRRSRRHARSPVISARTAGFGGVASWRHNSTLLIPSNKNYSKTLCYRSLVHQKFYVNIFLLHIKTLVAIDFSCNLDHSSY